METNATLRVMDRSRLWAVALAIALAAVLGLVQLAGDGPIVGGMPVPGADVPESIVGEDASNGMPVPGSEVDETTVGASTGMPVPGLDGVVDTLVGSGS
jgi:hypothetical protein